MTLDEIKQIKNKTLAYLLPLITTKAGKISDFKEDEFFPKCNFINAFRYCEEFPELTQHVFVVYKYSPIAGFEAFITRMKKNPNFHSFVDFDKVSVMLIYEIPFECLNALTLFDKGSYSKFRAEDKKKILDFYSATSSDIFGPSGVLYKKDWRRLEIEKQIGMSLPQDAELSSIPLLEEETYYNKYKVNNEQEVI
jgi:hypothetical protein